MIYFYTHISTMKSRIPVKEFSTQIFHDCLIRKYFSLLFFFKKEEEYTRKSFKSNHNQMLRLFQWKLINWIRSESMWLALIQENNCSNVCSYHICNLTIHLTCTKTIFKNCVLEHLFISFLINIQKLCGIIIPFIYRAYGSRQSKKLWIINKCVRWNLLEFSNVNFIDT